MFASQSKQRRAFNPLRIPATPEKKERALGNHVASTRYQCKNRITHNITQHPVSLRDAKHACEKGLSVLQIVALILVETMTFRQSDFQCFCQLLDKYLQRWG